MFTLFFVCWRSTKNPPKKVHESKHDKSPVGIFGAAGKPKINKYFLPGAAVIRFALRKSMVKTVKNEKLSEPQASFFRLGFYH